MFGVIAQAAKPVADAATKFAGLTGFQWGILGAALAFIGGGSGSAIGITLANHVASGILVEEMVAYRVQVPHALNLYKATNGHFPKTQEDFVREILEPNGIKLPELPEGHFYVYDPDKGELQVARPK